MPEVIEFLWEEFKPDQRQFRNQSISLMPAHGLLVSVSVPLEHELIHNFDDIIKSTLSGEEKPDPILTMKGLKYVIDGFDNLFGLETEEVTLANKDDEDWDDLGEDEPKKEIKSSAKDDEDWDKLDDETTSGEEKWDADNEDWQ